MMDYKINSVLYLIILVILSISPTFAEQNVFSELSTNELTELSVYYQNNSNAPAFVIYNQSNECNIEYPFYSYTLSLKCRRAILQKNISDLANVRGADMTIDSLTKTVQEDLNELQDEISITKQSNKSLACLEWISLGERDLNESKNYFIASQKSYRKDDFNATLIYLIKSDFAIYKTKNLLKLTKNKNNISSKVDNLRITNEGEKVASNWIHDATDKISLLMESDKKEDILTMAQDVLNESKRYYSRENYYLALMGAAEAKALAEFGLEREKYTSSTDALTQAERQVKTTNKSLNVIFEYPDIDAPLVELHFEMAKLRLEEAKNTKSISAIPFADTAIREALIAKEQSNAISDFKIAIESSKKTASRQTTFGLFPLMGAAIAVYMSRRWQRD
ncbi:MAG: hypothetical protein U9N86_10655 [Bacteroidota bacterium]|nr:hypothetical protein [Bacteroidota bacterium]